jgi:hypothetical protein
MVNGNDYDDDDPFGLLDSDRPVINPVMQKKIKYELDNMDSISSAVFENMMRNNEIKADVLREFERIA